jgi:hypothetical protein
MVEKIWRSIDPEFFTLVEDILEDTLQSVSPGFIVSCQKNYLCNTPIKNDFIHWIIRRL